MSNEHRGIIAKRFYVYPAVKQAIVYIEFLWKKNVAFVLRFIRYFGEGGRDGSLAWTLIKHLDFRMHCNVIVELVRMSILYRFHSMYMSAQEKKISTIRNMVQFHDSRNNIFGIFFLYVLYAFIVFHWLQPTPFDARYHRLCAELPKYFVLILTNKIQS